MVSRTFRRVRLAMTAVGILLPCVASSEPTPIGTRFPDWPVESLVTVVDANPGLRTLLLRDRDLALQAIERLLMPPHYMDGDENRCPVVPPATGSLIPFDTGTGRACVVAYVISLLRSNPVVADALGRDSRFVAELLRLMIEAPVEDRQSPILASPPPPSDPESAAVLAANPDLEVMYQTSPEAVLSIIEMLRLAAQ